MSKRVPLVPPDTQQCQAEYLAGNFMTLGPRSMTRCTRKPLWIAKENKPGLDGRRGSMSLCGECAEALEFIKGKKFATLKEIGNETKTKKKIRKKR